MTRELSDPHHATAGWVGVPGDRTFYLQFEDASGAVTLLCEKGQVAGIAVLLAELLARVQDEPATDWDRTAMELRDPIEPLWRVGGIAVGVDPDRDRFLMELSELVPEGDEADRAGEGGESAVVDEVHAWLNRDQTRRLAAHAAEVVGQGRPTCHLCARPREPEGHVCPATNGHGRLSR
ncbi:MAG TPA: DUF3090 family protein [Nitriliruptorales bacterium]